MKRISICLIITFCFVQNVVFAQVHGVENGHGWVDLGLPSGTKWATCNVGAKRPEQYGGYYAWGETNTKETYSMSTYLDGRITVFSDYGTDKDLLKGVTDIAGTRYDAAYVNWGGKWRMPTKSQQDELRNECCWVWTSSYNGSNVKGYIVYKAKNSRDKGKCVYRGGTPSSSYSLSNAHIFLPAAGIRDSRGLGLAGSIGRCWASSRNGCESWCVHFDSANVYEFGDNAGRSFGQSVRAVIPGK